jgi:hypothetical protein
VLVGDAETTWTMTGAGFSSMKRRANVATTEVLPQPGGPKITRGSESERCSSPAKCASSARTPERPMKPPERSSTKCMWKARSCSSSVGGGGGSGNSVRMAFQRSSRMSCRGGRTEGLCRSYRLLCFMPHARKQASHLLKGSQARHVRLPFVIKATVLAAVGAGGAERVLFHVAAKLLPPCQDDSLQQREGGRL